MKEWVPKAFRLRASRRDTLAVIGTAVGLAAVVALLYDDSQTRDNKEEPIKTPEKTPRQEDGALFTPSIEIGKEIDPETFKKVVNELFDFANLVDAGKFYRLEKITNTESVWTRKIPFMKKGAEWANIHLTWGLRPTEHIGLQLYNLGSRVISINYFNNGASKAEVITIGFTKEMEPTQYYPAPLVDKENRIVKPIPLSPSQMADFLIQTIEAFNHRIDEKPSPPRDPYREKGYL